MKNCVKKCVKKHSPCDSCTKSPHANAFPTSISWCWSCCASNGNFSIDTEAVFFTNPLFIEPFGFGRTTWNEHLSAHIAICQNSIWYWKRVEGAKNFRKMWRNESNKDIRTDDVFIFHLSCQIYRYNFISLHRRVYIERAVIFSKFFCLLNIHCGFDESKRQQQQQQKIQVETHFV